MIIASRPLLQCPLICRRSCAPSQNRPSGAANNIRLFACTVVGRHWSHRDALTAPCPRNLVSFCFFWRSY